MHRRAVLVSGAACALSGCSVAGAFAALTPKDAGGRRVATGLAYGPHRRQAMDVYAPAAHPETPAPVVAFFYGGSWDSGSRSLYPWLGRALAARGFVVAVPDYRLVPEVRFPAFAEDGAAALRAVREVAPRFGGDAGRIGLMGHSAGAWLALTLALDPRWTEAAGVPRAAVRAAVGLAGPYDFLPFDVPASQEAFGRWPRPAETQPVSFASADDPPVLLLTGDDDATVRPRNSLALAERLKAAGGRAETKVYRGVDHTEIVAAFSRPFRGRAPVLEDAAAFFRREL